MKEYKISTALSREPSSLIAVATYKRLGDKSFKEDAEMIYSFLENEVSMGVKKELRKLMNKEKPKMKTIQEWQEIIREWDDQFLKEQIECVNNLYYKIPR